MLSTPLQHQLSTNFAVAYKHADQNKRTHQNQLRKLYLNGFYLASQFSIKNNVFRKNQLYYFMVIFQAIVIIDM